ncbi:MAG TPA: hypothetical protein PKD79_03340 [Candidatus Doudnabacteria bacterium]|nr:hypothetical protein [Candidatus Doudnabacteria bacterium]
MNKYQPTIDRLIMQYHEYMSLYDAVKNLENEKLAVAAEEAGKQNVPLSTILKALPADSRLSEVDEYLKILQLDLQRISDEMSFANHVIWLAYKYQAYKGESNEILTLGALRAHCSPNDYICTKRFTFLVSYLSSYADCNLQDKVAFPDEMPLAEFIEHRVITELLDDVKFLKLWKSYEYYTAEQSIAKWKNFAMP